MNVICFAFFGLFALCFILLHLNQRLSRKTATRIHIANWTIIITSYVFIAYADWRFALILLIYSLFCFTIGVMLSKGSNKEVFMAIGVTVSILLLGVFKYANFFLSSFETILGITDHIALNLILPLGISFFVFSGISYIIDIYKDKATAGTVEDVLLYISFFPKLTSGPISRPKDFIDQIHEDRHLDFQSFSWGIQVFVYGMLKKLVLADRLSLFVNEVYETPLVFSSFTVLLAMISYSLQIYFDFSGYSDMAIGLARILGIRLPRNFNVPYLSQNVTEFWKRWHMSLSSWLMDYVYIPLGGSRKGVVRGYINLFLTMLIGGLWHGAAWTFVIWGLLQGLSLIAHKLWMKAHGGNKNQSIVVKVCSTILTFFFVTISWVFFRATSFKDAIIVIMKAFSFATGLSQMYFWSFVSIVAIVLYYIYTSHYSIDQKRKNFCTIDAHYPIMKLKTIPGLTFFFITCGSILGFAYTGGSPFIYGAF